MITPISTLINFCQSPALLTAPVLAHEEVGLLPGLARQAAVEGGLGTGETLLNILPTLPDF